MATLKSKIFNKIVRELNAVWILTPVRQLEYFQGQGKYKLLIIAPGELAIPTGGWGAVETIISETISEYISHGFNVTLLNSKNRKDWRRTAKNKYDVLLCHSDNLGPLVHKYFPTVPSVAISHYGYAAFKNMWHMSYQTTLMGLENFSKICCLAPNIEQTLKQEFPGWQTFISSNGSSFNPEIQSHGKPMFDAFACIGKVEERKGQFDLYQRFKKSPLKIHFLGDIKDSRVEELVKSDVFARESFVGPRSREWLRDNLSRYRGLLLLSKGEADALVLYEAQLAGLPIFVTKEALGAQDENLPWVRVVSYDLHPAELVQEAASVVTSKKVIAEFAQKNYRWGIRNKNLTNHLYQLASEGEVN